MKNDESKSLLSYLQFSKFGCQYISFKQIILGMIKMAQMSSCSFCQKKKCSNTTWTLHTCNFGEPPYCFFFCFFFVCVCLCCFFVCVCVCVCVCVGWGGGGGEGRVVGQIFGNKYWYCNESSLYNYSILLWIMYCKFAISFFFFFFFFYMFFVVVFSCF